MGLRKVLIGIVIVILILGISAVIWVSLQPEKVIKIKGPSDAIFNFADDGYWWPGRTVEKWVEVKNIGTLPFDFSISSSGQDRPSYDAQGDGANVSLQVGWPEWEDIDQDDHGIWHIEPGSSQKVLIRVYFPYQADNTAQGDHWNLTFTFLAVQCSKSKTTP